MNTTTAVKFFEANPRATAREAGLTTAEANSLVGAGKLMQAGHRKTGKKGRPPVEYVVIGYDLSDDPAAQAAVLAAQDRVRQHRNYERMSTRMMQALDEFGVYSDEYLNAKLLRRETYTVLPPLPSRNDYVLAGVIAADAPPEDDSIFEVDDLPVVS